MKRSLALRGIALTVVLIAAAACGGDDGGGPTAPEVPSITEIGGLESGSIRAGELVVIRGTNLLAIRRSVSLAGAPTEVQVLLDGTPLQPESVTDTEIRFRIPLELAPGSHTLAVRIGGQTSNTITFNVEVFTASGLYRGEARLTFDNCEVVGVPVGAVRPIDTVVIDARPAITMRRGELAPMTGTLAPDGSFTASFTETREEQGAQLRIELRIEGQLLVDEGEPTLSAEFTAQVTDVETSDFCRFADEDFARRISTETEFLRAPLAPAGTDRPGTLRRLLRGVGGPRGTSPGT